MVDLATATQRTHRVIPRTQVHQNRPHLAILIPRVKRERRKKRMRSACLTPLKRMTVVAAITAVVAMEEEEEEEEEGEGEEEVRPRPPPPGLQKQRLIQNTTR